MAEVLFYHLQRQPLDAVLPTLLLRSLERGWRVVVEVGEPERLQALDDHLWTFSDDSFLPHGAEGEADLSTQPVALVSGPQNPNGASVRFLVHGARAPDEVSGLARIVLMFDGDNETALTLARDDWRRVKAMGLEATYWQQNDEGRWVRAAG